MPLPPSDLTSSAIRSCGPLASRIACSAITSLSQTEPLVEVQYVRKVPSTFRWIALDSACVFS